MPAGTPSSLPSPQPAASNAAAAVVDRPGQGGEGTVSAAVAIVDTFDRSKMPEMGQATAFNPPPVVRRKLSNGLDLLIAETHQSPILTMRLICRGGDNVVPGGKEGLAAMTAHLLTEGTLSRDAVKLAGELLDIGASLGSTGGIESSGLALSALTRHEAKAIELFADVLLHPSFPEKDFERIRTLRLAAVLRRRDTAGGIAGFVFPKLLYGSSHPYGRTETSSSIEGLSRDDVVQFYKTVFLPNNSALIVVGDTTPDAITAKLEAALHGWRPGEPPQPKYPDPPPPQPLTVYMVDKPGWRVGHRCGTCGCLPRYARLFRRLVMNAVLGGQSGSRINLNLREDKGYTYGARSTLSFRQGPGPFEATQASRQR